MAGRPVQPVQPVQFSLSRLSDRLQQSIVDLTDTETKLLLRQTSRNLQLKVDNSRIVFHSVQLEWHSPNEVIIKRRIYETGDSGIDSIAVTRLHEKVTRVLRENRTERQRQEAQLRRLHGVAVRMLQENRENLDVLDQREVPYFVQAEIGRMYDEDVRNRVQHPTGARRDPNSPHRVVRTQLGNRDFAAVVAGELFRGFSRYSKFYLRKLRLDIGPIRNTCKNYCDQWESCMDIFADHLVTLPAQISVEEFGTRCDQNAASLIRLLPIFDPQTLKALHIRPRCLTDSKKTFLDLRRVTGLEQWRELADLKLSHFKTKLSRVDVQHFRHLHWTRVGMTVSELEYLITKMKSLSSGWVEHSIICVEADRVPLDARLLRYDRVDTPPVVQREGLEGAEGENFKKFRVGTDARGCYVSIITRNVRQMRGNKNIVWVVLQKHPSNTRPRVPV